MIPAIKTVIFINELVNQNSAPSIFLCDDFKQYYCKSILDNSDHDFLVYEFIGSYIARYFGISTPEIAWVKFDELSMGSEYFQKNYNIKNGDILFGSQYIGENDHLDSTGKFKIKNKKIFSRLKNPEDLIKISLMDIHLNNMDRNEDNYNLLFQTEKNMFYAIDHSALFGGPALKNTFSPRGEPSMGQKLLGSEILLNVIKFISFDSILEIIDEYFSGCNFQLEIEINHVFGSLPESWIVSPSLKERILEYTLNETRLGLFKLLVTDRLYKIKKKR